MKMVFKKASQNRHQLKFSTVAQAWSKPASVATLKTPEPKIQPKLEFPPNYQSVLDSLEYLLTQFKHHQGHILQVHEEFLKHQTEYAETFVHLIQQQNFLVEELHTLAQIVGYIREQSDAAEKKVEMLQNESSSQNHNIVRGLIRLKAQQSPDFLDFTLPEFSVGLITDDGSLTTSKLAQSLIERGWKVVVLSFPDFLVAKRSPLPEGITRVVLKDLSEEHLKQQLAVISTNYGSIAAFIHLNPASRDNQSKDMHYLEAEAALVKQVFLIAKHLKQPLNRAARQGRSCFITVAHLDGEFGTLYQTNFGAISGGLFGLTKTLKQEWSAVFCRAIDLSSDLDVDQSVQYILAELHDPNCLITEVGYSFQGRTTLVCEPSTITERVKDE